MTVKRKDLLFENVWQTYALDPFAKAAFLESLEAFILSDQLRNLPVSSPLSETTQRARRKIAVVRLTIRRSVY